MAGRQTAATQRVLITRAVHELMQAAAWSRAEPLGDQPQVYRLLRYGVKVKEEAGEQNQRSSFVDWGNPENNDFAVAEEVTVFGKATDAVPTWCSTSTASRSACWN